MDQSNPGGDPGMRMMLTFILSYNARDTDAVASVWLVSFHMSEGGVATFCLPSF